jgi:hypothetical protein
VADKSFLIHIGDRTVGGLDGGEQIYSTLWPTPPSRRGWYTRREGGRIGLRRVTVGDNDRPVRSSSDRRCPVGEEKRSVTP